MKVEKNKQAVAFGGVLKELRREAEMSQDALAERADLERTFISFLERGERQPTISTILALAAALGIDADEMVRLTVKRLGR
jgi:transcriptional regulator with XRE-family HTH domain